MILQTLISFFFRLRLRRLGVSLPQGLKLSQLHRIGKALLLASLLLGSSGCSYGEKKLTADDRLFLFTAQDLIDSGLGIDATIVKKAEFYHRTNYRDGGKSHNYELSIEPDQTASKQGLYINTSIYIETSETRAKEYRYKDNFTMRYIEVAWRATAIHRPKFPQYGDQSRSMILLRDKDQLPLGSFFVVRKKNIVYNVVIAGIFIDDAEAWTKIIQPKLDEVEKRFIE